MVGTNCQQQGQEDIKRQVCVCNKIINGSKQKLGDRQALMTEASILAQDYLDKIFYIRESVKVIKN